MKNKTLIIFFVILFSCEKEVKKYKPISSGRINSVSVIIDKSDWESNIGLEIRNAFASEFKGLPQIEETFNLNQIPYKAFTGFGRTARNIIFINQKKDDKPKMVRDKFARPQLFLEIYGTDEKKIIENLKKVTKFSVDEFQKGEIAENKRRIIKSPLNTTNLEESLSLSLTMPSAYSIFKQEKQTSWFQKPLKTGTSNIIISELEVLQDAFNVFNLEDVIVIRDSLNKSFVPGRNKGSFMITEEAYLPYFSSALVNGFPSIETRGTWEVNKDFMGGPFLNYIINDTINNRLLYFEGFVFSPSQRKRDGIIEIESIIKSLKVFEKN